MHAHAALGQPLRRHRLDAEVDGGDRGDGSRRRAERLDHVGGVGGHLAGEVGAGHRGRGERRRRAARRRAGARRPSSSSAAPEKIPARITPRSRRCRVRARVSISLMPTMPCATRSSSSVRTRAPVRRPARGVAHHVAGHPDPRRLVVLVVHAGVADVRRRHDDDLPVVRRVGERLLVAGHAGVEDDLAQRRALGAVGAAGEGPAVLEHEHCVGHEFSSCAGAGARGQTMVGTCVDEPRRGRACVLGSQAGVQAARVVGGRPAR